MSAITTESVSAENS